MNILLLVHPTIRELTEAASIPAGGSSLSRGDDTLLQDAPVHSRPGFAIDMGFAPARTSGRALLFV
jgi:hypothetical protein